MNSTKLVTGIEHKLLLRFTLLAFFLLLSNFVLLVNQSYNLSIEEIEVIKEIRANNPLTSSINNRGDFTTSECGRTMSAAELNRFLAFLFLPLSFFLLRRFNFWKFLISFSLVSLLFANFILWSWNTVNFWSLIETDFDRPLIEKFLLDSTVFDIYLFIIVSIIFVWQITILRRYVSRFRIEQIRR